MTKTEEIDDRIAWAEAASYQNTGSQGGWHKHYADNDFDLETLKSDFRWMRKEITKLRDENAELRYKLEAAGVEV